MRHWFSSKDDMCLCIYGYLWYYIELLQNIVYDNPNYYSSADQLLSVNSIANEPMPYLDPVETIGKFPDNDYEAPPNLDNHVKPHPVDLFDDVQYEVADYPLPIGAGSNTMQNGTLPVGEALPEDEQIYEDPGHIKEEIYQWFKQRNICKLHKNSIWYVHKLNNY